MLKICNSGAVSFFVEWIFNMQWYKGYEYTPPRCLFAIRRLFRMICSDCRYNNSPISERSKNPGETSIIE